MKTKYIANIIIGTFVLIILSAELIGSYYDFRDKPKIEPLTEFQSVMKEKIISITISSSPSCKQPFEFQLPTVGTNAFLQASRGADTGGITGHSNRIFEANIVIKTTVRSVNYIATVNSQQYPDLFLNRVLSSPDREGRLREWQYREIRLPGMGKWIIQLAPGAAL